MHIISYKRLRKFNEKHSDSLAALDNWYKIANKAKWTNLIDIQLVFPTAEAVGNLTVFNIKGNKYRLIVSIDYERQLIYIKYILTHSEYDRRCDPASAQDARERAPRQTNGKMTLTFNQEKYKELLCQYQPKLIKNEADNETALKAVEQLMHTNNRTPEEDELYDLLITLIEKFEQEHYQPGSTSTPVSMLHFLMEQQGIEERDLIQIFGSQYAVAEILHGKAMIGVDKVEALSNLFNVDRSLFI